MTNEANRNQDTIESWAQPFPVDKEFPRQTADWMPAYDSIPQQFRRQSNPWVLWQTEWFFNGLKAAPVPLDGIDGKAALHHLSHIQRAWDVSHEHKMAGVAYLASLWFQGGGQ